MNQKPWKVYTFWILLTEAVGALSGWLTRDGMEIYQSQIRQPPLSPPGWVFPVVWVILFALMGIGMAKVWLSPPSHQRQVCLWLYLIQLAFNFCWSLFFFNLQWFGFALVWLLVLWLLILAMIRAFSHVSHSASLLQLPYLIWVTFAAYLNFGVWLLNR